VVLLGRRVAGTANEVWVRRGFALAIPAVTVPLQVVDFLPGNFGLHSSLPLHLCDFAWVAASCALWTRNLTACALIYYWGLLLTPQGIVTPTLDHDFPDPKFLAYWGMHLLIVYAAVFLTWGLRIRPGWRGYRATLAATGVWLVAVYVFNVVVGTNYGYLNHKPGTATLLDVLGPWPWYVVAEVGLAAAAWAAMTWPWTRQPVRQA
jgi:hypothetical integral membrane protein (TIGR02206 family)